MDYLTEIKVRGYHADAYGHVNNARFLEFLEEDRWAHLDASVDLDAWAKKGLFFLVVNININYRKPVLPGETVLVGTSLEKIGTKSAVWKQEIVIKDTGVRVTDARVTFVIGDLSGKAIVLEGKVLEEIKKIGNGTQH